MTSTPDMASALVDAARAINSPRTLQETLDAIVQATKASVPGFDEAGISLLHHDGSFETKAATSRLVWDLDGLQYDLDEGPCIDAMRGGGVVAAPGIRHDQRWPEFVPRAVAAGLKAQLGVQLYAYDTKLGGLNLYSTTSEAIDPSAEQAAELFAAHAALALARARRESDLVQAIESRQDVGMAIGLVMCRYRIDRDHAFQFLVRASSTSEIKVRDIAAEIIRTAEMSYARS